MINQTSKQQTLLQTALVEHTQTALPYYQQWMLDKPLVISQSRFKDIEKLQIIMSKLIRSFVTHYDQFSHLMPVSTEVAAIIDVWAKYEYQIGTYRTDFVFDRDLQCRPIEITCRFAMNGYFLTGILNNHVTQYPSHTSAIDFIFPYDDFLSYFLAQVNKHDSIIVLKDSETKNESKIFEPILKRAGIDVLYYSVEEINARQGQFDEHLIINELTLDELKKLNLETHRNLAQANFLNDIRTVFLVHDKRFFSVIHDIELQTLALEPEEIEWCQKILIPSHTYSKSSKIWLDAKYNKNNWILKHRALGKSEAVYAGPVTSEEEWQALFARVDINEFIIQQWIPQPRFKAYINDSVVEDYFTGTVLYFNERNFGLAEFRTSSFPVTNQGDHRKCMSLILKDDTHFLNIQENNDYILLK